jgi:hypothetical protein
MASPNSRGRAASFSRERSLHSVSHHAVASPESHRRANNAAGRKSWAGETTTRGRGWDEDPSASLGQRATVISSSPRAQPKLQSSSSRNPRPLGKLIVSPTTAPPDQLANIKKQWNMERDIPSGTVRNNPFLPKPEPINAPPPQLMHQKRQWDTKEIPRGAVAARAMSMEEDPMEEDLPVRLRLSTQTQQQDRNPQRAMSPQQTQTPTITTRVPVEREPRAQPRNRRSVPMTSSNNGTSLRGRLIENPFLTSSQPPSHQQLHQHPPKNPSSSHLGARDSGKWPLSKDIPKRTVKGRMTTLLGKSGANSADSSQDRKKHNADEDSDEDPWIIPSQASASSQVFPGDWGEAVAAKSSESDDWDTPTKDWFRSSESQTTTSRTAEEEPFKSKKSSRLDRRPQRDQEEAPTIYECPPEDTGDLGIVEEKKLNEDESIAGHRDADVLEMARKKQFSQDIDDPFGTTHARDADILQAAKQKSFFPDTTRRSLAPQSSRSPSSNEIRTPKVLSPKGLAPPPRDVMSYNSDHARHEEQPHSKAFDDGLFVEDPSNPRSFDDDVFADATSSFKSSYESFDETFAEHHLDKPKGDFSAQANLAFDTEPDPFAIRRYPKSNGFEATQKADKNVGDQTVGWEKPFELHQVMEHKNAIEVGDSLSLTQISGQQRPASQVLLFGGESDSRRADEDFFDAPSSKYTGCPGSTVAVDETGQGGSPNLVVNKRHQENREEHSSPLAMSEKHAEDSETPKKQRKGFFKFFGGGGRKERYSQAKQNKEKATRSSRRSAENSDPTLKESLTVSNRNTPGNTVSVDKKKKRAPAVETGGSDLQERSSSENLPEESARKSLPNPSQIYNKRSEDDTTISDMTLPTVFKDVQNPGHHTQNRMSPALSTIASRDMSTPSPRLSSLPTFPSEEKHLNAIQSPNQREPSFPQAQTRDSISLHGRLPDEGTTKKTDFDDRLLADAGISDQYEQQDEDTADFSDGMSYSNRIIGTRNGRVGQEELSTAYALQSGLCITPPPSPPRHAQARAEHNSTSYSDPMNVEDPALDHMNIDDDSEEEVGMLKLKDALQKTQGVEQHSADAHVPTNSNLARRKKADKLRKFEEVAERNRKIAQGHQGEQERPLPAPPSVVQSVSATTNFSEVSSRSSRFYRRNRTSKCHEIAETPSAPPKIERLTGNKGFIPQNVEVAEVETTFSGPQPVQSKTPNFVTRHARTKGNLAELNRVRKEGMQDDSPDESDVKIQMDSSQLHLTRRDYEQKFPKASKAFRHYGKERASATSMPAPSTSLTQKASGGSTNFNLLANPSQPQSFTLSSARSPGATDPSARSHRTSDSSSVGSDIRVLRSILRRPRLAQAPENFANPKPVFASYDETNITDPMQRAGLRLLSAAIIPIQTEVRRFLAMRRALTRMWALIVIQTYARRWMARKQYQKEITSIVAVQALFRGGDARNDLVYHHICVIEIQRFVRGYLATMRVYEDIYKVTMVQSYVRMKLAMDKATHRMALVIQLQSVVRSFLTRRRLEYQEACAVAIQANWRCFFTRLTYQFDLLDIIIVQSVWRRRVATRKVELLRQERRDRFATILQAKWRSYDCTMNYLHFLADVLIAQSAVRRFLSKKHVAGLKNHAATTIQSIARCYIKRRYFGEYCAARKIQSVWRGCVKYRSFGEYFSARTIQSAWRTFIRLKSFREYCATRQIQSAWRGFIKSKSFGEYCAARKIQSAWRGFVCYADYMFSIADIVVVQKLARRWLAIRAANKLRYSHQIQSATTIQRAWRDFYCARRIQRAWRSHSFHVERKKAAIRIQQNWRCFVDETEYVVMKYEFYAARTIQSYWRRFWCFSNFIIALDCSIQIQSVFRGYLQRRKFDTMHLAATHIQSACRIYLSKREACRMSMVKALSWASTSHSGMENSAATSIQRIFRGAQARQAVSLYSSARKIQSLVRGRQARTAVRLYLCARLIQARWRSVIPRRVYISFIATRRIQTFWRCKRMHNAYKYYRAALIIQTQFRAIRARQDVLVVRGECLAATLIQCAWRGFVCYTDYIFTVSDIIATQKLARAYLARKKYSGKIKGNVFQKKQEMAGCTKIQKVCRGFIARQRYWYTLGCTMQIQSWIRGRLAVLRVRGEQKARLTLQCFARRCFGRQEYLQRKFIYMLIQTAEQERTKRVAAMLIQEQCRTCLEQRGRDQAARVIQRFFLMVKFEVDRMVRATKRRRNWRKKTKNRHDNVEDALLEDAWLSAVSHSNLENDPISRHISNVQPAASLDLGRNKNDQEEGNRSQSRDPSRKNKQGPGNTSRQDRSPNVDSSKNQEKKRHRVHKISTIVRLDHDDDRSEFSGLTASTANFIRMPLPRMRRLDSGERDEDLALEEAFIDAEIFSAKERRMADKRSSWNQISTTSTSRRRQAPSGELPKGTRGRRPVARVNVLASST